MTHAALRQFDLTAVAGRRTWRPHYQQYGATVTINYGTRSFKSAMIAIGVPPLRKSPVYTWGFLGRALLARLDSRKLTKPVHGLPWPNGRPLRIELAHRDPHRSRQRSWIPRSTQGWNLTRASALPAHSNK